MRAASFIAPHLAPEVTEEIESRFRHAIRYFQARGSVLFLSYCQFWERHGQPQQSLAKLLVQNQVDVTWLDGVGWRPYHPTIHSPSRHLKVRQLFALPYRSRSWMSRLNDSLQAELIKQELRRRGKHPVIWVQGGIEESLAARLPYVDVFSFFDDCYRHLGDGELCQKARLIVTQNTYARECVKGPAQAKTRVSFPPIDVSIEVFRQHLPLTLPPNFPQKRMGYIGSFFPHDYDLDLFEDFIRSLPDWGFFLMGRTNEVGLRYVDRFRRYRNFWAQPWVPRSQVAAAWKAIDVNLLLYRSCRSQDGAFPTKILESLHFGVPAVATQLTKTADLEGFFPRSAFADKLKQLAQEVAVMPKDRIAEFYRHFSVEMSPKLHLARIVEWLEGKG